jgi:hypothetical protein
MIDSNIRDLIPTPEIQDFRTQSTEQQMLCLIYNQSAWLVGLSDLDCNPIPEERYPRRNDRSISKLLAAPISSAIHGFFD